MEPGGKTDYVLVNRVHTALANGICKRDISGWGMGGGMNNRKKKETQGKLMIFSITADLENRKSTGGAKSAV